MSEREEAAYQVCWRHIGYGFTLRMPAKKRLHAFTDGRNSIKVLPRHPTRSLDALVRRNVCDGRDLLCLARVRSLSCWTVPSRAVRNSTIQDPVCDRRPTAETDPSRTPPRTLSPLARSESRRPARAPARLTPRRTQRRSRDLDGMGPANVRSSLFARAGVGGVARSEMGGGAAAVVPVGDRAGRHLAAWREAISVRVARWREART